MNQTERLQELPELVFRWDSFTGLPTSFTESIINAPNSLTSISATQHPGGS